MAVGFLSVVLVLAKLADRSGISLLHFLFFRQLVPACLIAIWLSHRGQLVRLRTSRMRDHVSRAITGLIGIYLVTAAAQLLPLAEATLFHGTSLRRDFGGFAVT
jgi:drug/metabolite transporter (DMT)-like permease